MIKVKVNNGEVSLTGFEKPAVPHWHFNSEHTRLLWGKREVHPLLGVPSTLLYSVAQ